MFAILEFLCIVIYSSEFRILFSNTKVVMEIQISPYIRLNIFVVCLQYVKDYKDKETQEAVVNQCEPKWQFPATTETTTTLDSSRENKKSSCLERDVLDTFASTAGRVIPTGSSQVDHPAQNMLDVFLGPLLRTTLEKEENWRRENLS